MTLGLHSQAPGLDDWRVERRSIYLDQNKWVELLRANSEGGQQSGDARRVLERLREGLAGGELVVPLSSAHYLEIWHRSNWESRRRLAELMVEISRYHTILPVQHLACLEVEQVLLDRFRSPRCECRPKRPAEVALGIGVNHAFHSSTGRLRVVASVAQPGVPEGPREPASSEAVQSLLKLKELPGDTYEWWSLAGFPDDMKYDGLESRSEHRRGRERVEREEAVTQDILANREIRARLEDFLMTQELIALNETINVMGFWHGADTNRLMATWLEVGPEFGRELLHSIPTAWCVYVLRLAKHRNPQWKWQQHDLTDMAALSASVPYCDIVVTEKQWVHAFRSAKADARFGTKLLAKLTDLLAIL